MSEGFIDLLSYLQGGFAGVLPTPYQPITYPLNLPAAPGIRSITWRAERSMTRSTSNYTYITQIQEFQGERWVANVQMPDMNEERGLDFSAFLLLLNGDYGTFLLGDPVLTTPNGAWLGTPKIATADQSGRVLTLNGLTPSTILQARRGDWIQLGNYRLHQVLRDADSDSSGNLILNIWPRLRQVYPVDDAVVVTNCKGQFRMTGANFDVAVSDYRRIFSVSFQCEEAL